MNLIWIPFLGGRGGGRIGTAVGGDYGVTGHTAGHWTTVLEETGTCILCAVAFELSSEVSDTFTTDLAAGIGHGGCDCQCNGGRGPCTYRSISLGVMRPKFMAMEVESVQQENDSGSRECRYGGVYFIHVFYPMLRLLVAFECVCKTLSVGLNMQRKTVSLQLNSKSYYNGNGHCDSCLVFF
jgi:hypothetical protein